MSITKFEDIKVGHIFSIGCYAVGGEGYCSKKDGDGTVEMIIRAKDEGLVHKIKFGKDDFTMIDGNVSLSNSVGESAITYGDSYMDPEFMPEYKLLMKELEAKHL